MLFALGYKEKMVCNQSLDGAARFSIGATCLYPNNQECLPKHIPEEKQHLFSRKPYNMTSRIILLTVALLINCSLQAQQSWEVLNPQASIETPSQIKFISDERGFILNEKELLSTNDGGETWEIQQPVPLGLDMAFIGDTGFIVGRFGLVLKTTDAGDNWDEIDVGNTFTYQEVVAVSPDTVYLLSRRNILRSFDGGTSWSMPEFPTNEAITMAFTDGLTGHVANGDNSIIRTTDGGANWTVRLASTQSSSDFTAMQFATPSIGYVAQSSSRMFKTEDGGDTWFEAGSTSTTFNAIHFTSPTEGVGIGSSGAIYKTTNGAISWERSDYDGAGFQYTTLYALDLFDDGTGYAVGLGNLLIKTTDGGSSWQNTSPLYRSIVQIDFPSSTVGYARTFRQLFRSSDGGYDWTKVTPGSSVGNLGAFQFIAEDVGYLIAAGSNSSNDVNAIYKTTDGGESWQNVAAAGELTQESLNSINFVHPDTGYVSGGFNQFFRRTFRTTDGGQSWEQVADLSLQKMQFFTGSTGYGIEQIGSSLLKTTDGGVTWESILDQTDGEEIIDFHFPSLTTGYIVGEEDLHLKTINGGVTWQENGLPYGAFDQIRFLSPNLGYAFSRQLSNTLYRTENGGAIWSEDYVLLTVEDITSVANTAPK